MHRTQYIEQSNRPSLIFFLNPEISWNPGSHVDPQGEFSVLTKNRENLKHILFRGYSLHVVGIEK